ncbi:PAAR domain-containing protein [Burkholderia arboris]|uniref:PAAR domain-containing protein n=1 Tax=Burkholderia arboris TaxID=488730 RepID=UPI001582CBA5
MRGVIQVGDVHSHGGRVESGASNSEVTGRPVARIGDRCTCPIQGECVIVEGDSDFTVEGSHGAGAGLATRDRPPVHETACFEPVLQRQRAPLQ